MPDDDFPFGTKYHYYELDGMPIRQKNAGAIPEILGTKAWKPWPYMARLITEATPISKEEFDELYESHKKSGWTTADNDF
jgi:hypothetical protein